MTLRKHSLSFVLSNLRLSVSIVLAAALAPLALSGCLGCGPDLYPGDGGSTDGVCCDRGAVRPGPHASPDGGVPRDGGAVDGGEGGADGGCAPCSLVAERLFPTAASPVERHRACHLASPLAHEEAGQPAVLMGVGEEIIATDPLTGARLWGVTLPAPVGEMAFVVGTPLVLGDRLVVSYHTTPATAGNRDVLAVRHRHLVVVLDLTTGALDSAFPTVELAGEGIDADGNAVVFEPGQALGRAELLGGKLPGDAFGKVYVTFGNARDIQPWHGFAFELDLDAWLAAGAEAAISGFFVDTPEADCGQPGQSGSRQRICGGGLWAPSGPLLVPKDDGYDIVLASGNGRLDLSRDDYANTLMRLPPGLAFAPGCDETLCAGFDPDAPADACVESCSSLFVPRMPAGEDFSALVSAGRCGGLTMFECWANLDYIGGSTPVHVPLPGFEVLLYPAKDGAVYLVDANHLGTQYERRQLVPVCGTATSLCSMDWAGMIVTEPTLTALDGEPVALVPTFMPDGEQEAGVVALKIHVVDGAPALSELWRWPAPGSDAARTRFRTHPSRVSLMAVPGQGPVALVVEPRVSGGAPGRLLALDVATGALLLDAPLDGRGYRFLEPLILEDRVYVPSCESNAGDAWLEGYRIATLTSDAP